MSAIKSALPLAAQKGDLVSAGALLGMTVGISPLRKVITGAFLGAASGAWPPLLAIALATWITPAIPLIFAQASIFCFGIGKEDPGRTFDSARAKAPGEVRNRPNLFKQNGVLGMLLEVAPIAAAGRLEQRGYSTLATACLVGASAGHVITESLRAISLILVGALALLQTAFQYSVLGLSLTALSPLLLLFPDLGSLAFVAGGQAIIPPAVA